MAEPSTDHTQSSRGAGSPQSLVASNGTQIGELVSRVADDARSLASSELALAKLELRQALQSAVLSISAIVLGGVLALISLGLLCISVVVALEPLLPALWLRLVIMSVAYLCLGALISAVFVLRLRQTPLGLPQTRQETQQTFEALARQVRHE